MEAEVYSEMAYSSCHFQFYFLNILNVILVTFGYAFKLAN